MHSTATLPCLALLAALLAGCGGGGTPDDTTGAPVQATASGQQLVATVTGAVVKGPVDNAQVCAFSLIPSGKGQALGCTTSGADGSYSLAVAHEGPVLIEATGGSYTDEATGLVDVPLTAPLRAVGFARPGQPVTVAATPLTALAVQRALGRGPLSHGSFDTAAQEVALAFGVPAGTSLVDSIPRVDAGTTDLHGQALRGISRMLQRGATLSGLLGNADLQGLHNAYRLINPTGCLDTDSVPLQRVTGPSLALPAGQPIRTECARTVGFLDANGSILSPLSNTLGAALTAGASRQFTIIGTMTAAAAVTAPPLGDTQVSGGTVVISGSGSVTTTGTSGGTGTVSLSAETAPATGTTPVTGGTVVIRGSGGITTTGTSGVTGTVSLSAATAP